MGSHHRATSDHKKTALEFDISACVYAAECAQASEPESCRTAALHRLLTWYLHTADALHRTCNPDNRHVPLDPPPPACSPPVFTTHRQALDWANSERANLIPAVRQATAVGDDGIAWKLPAMLGPVFDYQGHLPDLLPDLHSALDATRRLGDHHAEGWILTCLAEAYLVAGRPARTAEFCQRALAISAETSDLYGQWEARYLEGISYLSGERFTEARDCIQQALVTARQAADLRAEGMSLLWLGAVHQHLGSLKAATNLCEKAAAILKKTGNRWQHAYAIQKLAEACHQQGRIGDALDHYRQAQGIFRETGDRRTEASILVELGQAQKAGGQADAARQSWQAALSIFEELGDTRAEQVRAQLKDVGVQESQQAR